MEQVSLSEIADTHGTPTFVYSEAAITHAYRSLADAFGEHPHHICYAVKANSNLAILQILADLGAGFDIVSGGELERVLRAGGDPATIVFSGVGKQDWEIEKALTVGIGCFNVESASELDRIEQIATRLNAVAPISIRVNPDVDAGTHPYIATGLKENKFGVSAEEAIGLYQQAFNADALKVRGIDCHIGSQITELSPFLNALEHVLVLLDQLEAMGIAVEHLDLGGGIGVRYRDETPLDTGEFASAILQVMGKRPQRLMFEPGRLITANAGLLLTRVNTLKQNEAKHFAVVDAAMNDLIRPALYQAWQDIVRVNEDPFKGNPFNGNPFNGNRADRQRAEWDVVGPVCETGDFLARARELDLVEGDLLAILSAGAYGFVMSSNYNTRGRAAEILVDGSTAHVIRQRETIDDLLQLETLKPKTKPA